MSRTSLLKASLVAALLLPFCSAAAEATTIPTTTVTCGFGQDHSGPCGGSSTDRSFSFFGGAYAVEVDFVGGFPASSPPLGFTVAVTDSPFTDPLPPGFQCLNITGTPDGCRQFDITPGVGAAWIGNVEITISWLFDTEALFPNTTNNLVRMFHLHGTELTDVTVLGSYFSAPAGCGTEHGHPNTPDPNPGHGCDPGVTGIEDSFSDVYVGYQGLEIDSRAAVAAPEPATLVLFGSGLLALAAVRRRAAKR